MAKFRMFEGMSYDSLSKQKFIKKKKLKWIEVNPYKKGEIHGKIYFPRHYVVLYREVRKGIWKKIKTVRAEVGGRYEMVLPKNIKENDTIKLEIIERKGEY